MPNRPYGNDFIVSTPKIDRWAERLYQDQKQRQLYNQRQVEALDDEFAKNVSGIRDADVGELTKVYGDWKMGNQQLMKQKGGATPQQQLELLRKKAEMYKLINESKSEKEREELTAKRYAIKPDDFNDNASELIIKGRQLPLSQKRTYKTKDASGKDIEMDLSNPENLMYQDRTNWVPVLQKAGGTLVPRGGIIKNPIPGGLETEEISFKAGNDPVEFYNNIVGSMNTSRASKSLATRYPFTPEEAAMITSTFEKLKEDPTFKNVYGDIKFPESSNLTEGTKTAKLLAMQNAINNPPVGTKKNVKNAAAVMDRTEAFKRSMQAQGFENSKVLASLRNYYSNMSYDQRRDAQSGDVDAYIDGQIENAAPSTGAFGFGGGRYIQLSPTEKEAFKDDNNYVPSRAQILPNGNFKLIGGFGSDGKEEPYKGVEITRSQYKAALVNKLFPTNVKIGQITKKPETPSNKTTTPKKKGILD